MDIDNPGVSGCMRFHFYPCDPLRLVRDIAHTVQLGDYFFNDSIRRHRSHFTKSLQLIFVQHYLGAVC